MVFGGRAAGGVLEWSKVDKSALQHLQEESLEDGGRIAYVWGASGSWVGATGQVGAGTGVGGGGAV